MMPVRVRSTTAGTCLASSEGVSARLKSGRAPFDPGARYATRRVPAERLRTGGSAGRDYPAMARSASGQATRPSIWEQGFDSPTRCSCGTSSPGRAPAFQAGERGSSPRCRSIPGYGVGAVAALWTRSPQVRFPHPELCPGGPTGRGGALKPRICRFESGSGYHVPSKLTRWSGAMVRRRLWVRIPPEARMWL